VPCASWCSIPPTAWPPWFSGRRWQPCNCPPSSALLVKGLNELGFPCELPAGAFYAFPDITRLGRDSRKAAAILLDQAHVATIPGAVFGSQGEGHVRFGYSTAVAHIEQGLEALRRV
jgi:aspartate/methionine/tyrosine aminotransferase